MRQRSEDFCEHRLHVGKGLGERGAWPEGIVATENTFDILLALVAAVVVEAELFAAEGRRTAEKAIELTMVAGGIGHKTSSVQSSVASKGNKSYSVPAGHDAPRY